MAQKTSTDHLDLDNLETSGLVAPLVHFWYYSIRHPGQILNWIISNMILVS